MHVVLEKKSDLTESLKMVGSDPKAAPDMYFFAHDKIGVYAEMDILAPITDIIPEEELDVYMDNTLEAATYKGEIYQLPVRRLRKNCISICRITLPADIMALWNSTVRHTMQQAGSMALTVRFSQPMVHRGWIPKKPLQPWNITRNLWN